MLEIRERDGPEFYLEAEVNRLAASHEGAWTFLRSKVLDGLFLWDLEEPENEWISPEFCRLLGRNPDDPADAPREWHEHVLAEDRGRALDAARRHCEDPNEPFDEVLRYRHADGSTRWIRCRGYALRAPDDRPVRLFGVQSDETGLRRAEEESRIERTAAETANAELRAFAYATSHDLKTPANTAQMLIGEVLATHGDGMDEDARDLLSLASRTLDGMQTLVEDLLRYTRITGYDAVHERVVPAEEVQGALEALGAQVPESGLAVEVGPLPDISASRQQIRILFENMFSNAMKYAREGHPPRVTVSLAGAARDGRIMIAISDNGRGIEPKLQPRVFEMFKRLHRDCEVPGHGLGLALCRRVAMNHGGDIRVTSRVGRGTTFSVDLPVWIA